MKEINRRWRLTNAEQSHVVEICQNDISEVKGIADYLIDGLQNGEGIIIFAPNTLRKNILTNIELLENFESLRSEGLIKFFSLELVLANVFINKIFVEKYFLDFIVEPIERMQSKCEKVRVYAGMTVLLWNNNQYGIAAYLEDYFVNLARKQKFSLFSSYLLSNHKSLSENSFRFLYDCYNHLNPDKKYDNFRVCDLELMNRFEESWQKFAKFRDE